MQNLLKRSAIILCAVAHAWMPSAAANTQLRHVVVVVWDGMRPDFVTEQNTPTLWKLAHEGVTFRNHHAVYLSATNVNGTALATGVYPNHSGLIANHEYRPQIDPKKPVDVEVPAVVQKGDELTGGKYIAFPTVAELVRANGGETVVAASKTVGFLHDRHVAQARGRTGVTLSAGSAWPSYRLPSIVAILGTFPRAHIEQDGWTTKAVTDVLWTNSIPVYSLLWLGEPDLTQHETAPGAGAALQSVRSSDDKLAAVLSSLDQNHVRESTDIFVVSDHGFSTIARKIELPKILADAGFDVALEFKGEPKGGRIMMVGGGGSVLFYVIGHDPAVTQRLVEFLQKSDYAGVLFAKVAMEGTFPLEQGMIDSRDAPDVVMSFRWAEGKNQFGVPGMIDADWQRAAGKGTHATLSRFDMHNTLIASGPDFRRGAVDDLPTGNVDVAPTVLHILGITPPQKMDGRILSEAMTNSGNQEIKPATETIEASRQFPSGTWRQSLRISRVGATMYLDEGNGSLR